MEYYTDKGRDGQDKQEKTCRKTQHVKIGMERDVPVTVKILENVKKFSRVLFYLR